MTRVKIFIRLLDIYLHGLLTSLTDLSNVKNIGLSFLRGYVSNWELKHEIICLGIFIQKAYLPPHLISFTNKNYLEPVMAAASVLMAWQCYLIILFG